jgi:hypothetical protein
MPAQPITIRAFDSDVVANVVANALTREYGSGLNVTTLQAEDRSSHFSVCVARRDGRRITNDSVQTLCAFASGAASVVENMILAAANQRGEMLFGACDLLRLICRPVEGDPFTNR